MTLDELIEKIQEIRDGQPHGQYEVLVLDGCKSLRRIEDVIIETPFQGARKVVIEYGMHRSPRWVINEKPRPIFQGPLK